MEEARARWSGAAARVVEAQVAAARVEARARWRGAAVLVGAAEERVTADVGWRAPIRRLLAEGKEPRRDGGAGPPWQGRRRD